MRTFIAAFTLLAAAPALGAEPIIDVHLHSEAVSSYGPPGQKFCMEMLNHVPPVDPAKTPILAALGRWNMDPSCKSPMAPSADDEALLRETLAILERRNITGVASGYKENNSAWKAAAPERIIAARRFTLGREGAPSPAELAADYSAGEFAVLAEVTNQYYGHGPNDEAFEPYWAMAEENDIPVGIHIGSMPPGAAYWNTGARAGLGDPFLLEEVLARHPRLRVYIMHSGMPLFERLIALMQQYPQVYAGTGVMQAVMTKEAYEEFLTRMINAGLGKRLMYGTDQMQWPEMIERSIKLVEETDVLTKEQKRDILYNNATRFFRLDAAAE